MIMKSKQENIVPESLTDSGGARDASDQISFIFMQFSAKILPKNGFLPKLRGWRPPPSPSGKSWIRHSEQLWFQISQMNWTNRSRYIGILYFLFYREIPYMWTLAREHTASFMGVACSGDVCQYPSFDNIPVHILFLQFYTTGKEPSTQDDARYHRNYHVNIIMIEIQQRLTLF